MGNCCVMKLKFKTISKKGVQLIGLPSQCSYSVALLVVNNNIIFLLSSACYMKNPYYTRN